MVIVVLIATAYITIYAKFTPVLISVNWQAGHSNMTALLEKIYPIMEFATMSIRQILWISDLRLLNLSTEQLFH